MCLPQNCFKGYCKICNFNGGLKLSGTFTKDWVSEYFPTGSRDSARASPKRKVHSFEKLFSSVPLTRSRRKRKAWVLASSTATPAQEKCITGNGNYFFPSYEKWPWYLVFTAYSLTPTHKRPPIHNQKKKILLARKDVRRGQKVFHSETMVSNQWKLQITRIISSWGPLIIFAFSSITLTLCIVALMRKNDNDQNLIYILNSNRLTG